MPRADYVRPVIFIPLSASFTLTHFERSGQDFVSNGPGEEPYLTFHARAERGFQCFDHSKASRDITGGKYIILQVARQSQILVVPNAEGGKHEKHTLAVDPGSVCGGFALVILS